MKELYKEELATHFGPKLCVSNRKIVGEALTGEMRARLLSCEITRFSGVDDVGTVGMQYFIQR